MSNSPERCAEQDDSHEPATERLASTPLLESVHADGYRWTLLDETDLDPPTWFPPN